jgi:NAD(P)-dependent dehydrogenase (short-subunit alcohol dehydrogenase family)
VYWTAKLSSQIGVAKASGEGISRAVHPARIRPGMPEPFPPLFSLSGKVALVTGGSRGVGLMIAEGLLRAGAKVYVSSRKKDACDRAARDLSPIGPCVPAPADVATIEGRAALVEAVRAREDRLHILVNCAGTAWGAPYAEYPESAFDKVLGLNVTATFALTRDLTPLLERAGTADDPARVVNVGSIAGLRVERLIGTGTFAYSASKAALHHLTRTLAAELGPRHITVNAIAPGFFESRMTAEVLARRGDAIVAACPLGRIGRPEEMAGIAIYLTSRAGAYTNGAVVPVDGGTSL